MKSWRLEITDIATYLVPLLVNAAMISLITGGPKTFVLAVLAVLILDIATIIFMKVINVRPRT
jgi:hypothetical protein